LHRRLSEAVQYKYLPEERHNGNYFVEKDEKINADIVITDGDLEIDGEINGSVIVVLGDIIINRSGVIRGDAIAVSGDIIRRSGAIIFGDEIQISWRSFVDRSARTSRRWTVQADSRRQFGIDHYAEDFDEGFDLRYNRVEGLFMSLDISKRESFNRRFFNLYGNVGYGFKSEEWRYTIGLERIFLDENSLTIGVKGYDLTDTDDKLIIGVHENSLAAVFLKEDFLDYHNRKGITGYISQQFSNTGLVRFEYTADKFSSIQNAANWTIFGGNKKFRNNPSITNGERKGFSLLGIIDTRSRFSITDKGWWIQYEGEYMEPVKGSALDYDRHILDIRRYQPLSRFENLNLRVIFGSSRGALPIQRRFYLGGIGTLRGMKYKQFSGSSMFLANIEYLFDPDKILSGPPSWFVEDFKIALFFDAGAAFEATTSSYFDNLNSDIIKHNVGVGITTHDEDLRLDFAWRTDTGDKDMRVTFRLNRTF